jgi:hypothetical protein
VSIEPSSWGSAAAQWNWQAVSVVVTDPDGNANEIQLRKVRQRAAPQGDDFWGFDRTDRADSKRASRQRGGGGESGGAGIFNWLFR